APTRQALLPLPGLQGTRDRGASPPTRDSSSAGRPPDASTGRSSIPSRREPARATSALEFVLRHAGHPSALAPPVGGQALDVSEAKPRPPGDRRRGPRARPAPRAREPALGLPANRRRAHWLGNQRLGDQRAQVPAR